ncbi:RNA polymerase sigma factor [Paenibacillus arenilitoris]|uniref:RNA polymerase sigma factor n=1 Tax=Paenibacillus arenilitoris TaxID=2772299 RepID=A0A927CQT5_9BACL|nr:sigma-70 family RNA polymerase sigma factor [Paenibacillus arenilitoris]MBD2871872.1 sigma-70 family RNA polymerase sigma factor [Paenibacillus arenilitoris]
MNSYQSRTEGSQIEIDHVNLQRQQSFDYIFKNYKDKIYSFFIHSGINAEDAQDLTQDTFLKIYRFLDQQDANKNLAAWIFKIASNTAKDYYWKSSLFRGRRSKLERLSTFDNSSTPESILLQKEQKQELQRILLRIPFNYRVILLLRFTNELSYEEIAEIMNYSVNKVSVHLHRAKKKVRKLLTNSEVIEFEMLY